MFYNRYIIQIAEIFFRLHKKGNIFAVLLLLIKNFIRKDKNTKKLTSSVKFGMHILILNHV